MTPTTSLHMGRVEAAAALSAASGLTVDESTLIVAALENSGFRLVWGRPKLMSDSSDTTKHTPGPWYARDCELIGQSTIIATLHWHSGRDRENKADASLIETAPDLLAALEALLACPEIADCDPRDKDPETQIAERAARAAIAKAKGLQNV
jgi:hypothetical protein